MFVVKKEKDSLYSLPVKEIEKKQIKNLSSELSQKILKLLAEKPSYSIELAKKLKMHEQKIYYHIRNLENAGIIRVEKEETKQGATAKYYSLVEPGFLIKFGDFQKTTKISQINKEHSKFLEPFVIDNQLNALIIVGSPDPHGPNKARSRDGYYGIDFALFLGTFLNYVPNSNVKLDTEVREDDLKKNLILIGGPITNKIIERLNNKLPIKFHSEVKNIAKEEYTTSEINIFSSLSKSTYNTDETGIIVKMNNPFNSKNKVLIIAGKRFSGTRAAIIAFLQNFDEIVKGNIYNRKIMAKVVEGIDLNSDGIVDAIEFRE